MCAKAWKKWIHFSYWFSIFLYIWYLICNPFVHMVHKYCGSMWEGILDTHRRKNKTHFKPLQLERKLEVSFCVRIPLYQLDFIKKIDLIRIWTFLTPSHANKLRFQPDTKLKFLFCVRFFELFIAKRNTLSWKLYLGRLEHFKNMTQTWICTAIKLLV